jgi:hypothetical protein
MAVRDRLRLSAQQRSAVANSFGTTGMIPPFAKTGRKGGATCMNASHAHPPKTAAGGATGNLFSPEWERTRASFNSGNPWFLN